MKITASAPTRISLFGGGTDVEPFAASHGGSVINIAIDKRIKVILENGDLSIEGSGGGGLGASGSTLVAVLGALKKAGGLEINKYEIAREAFDIEVRQWGWHGGCQDHFAAAYGGFNLMDIGKDAEVGVLPLPVVWLKNFYSWMLLFDTNIKRHSPEVQKGFQKPSPEQIEALYRLKEHTGEAINLFKRQDCKALGELLDEAWQYKKQSNKVSNDELNEIYSFAKLQGAIGGKIMGAGQGGHFLFIVRPIEKDWFIRRMEKKGLTHVPFGIDWVGLEVKCEA